MADNKDIKNQKELTSEVRKNLSFEEEILFILNKRRGITGETLKDQQDISNVLADQTKQLKFQIQEKREITSLSGKINRIAATTYSINKEELGLTKTNNDLIKNQLDLDKTIQSLTQQQNKLLIEGGELNVNIATSIGMQVKEAVKLKDEITKVQEESEKISNSFGVKAFGGLSKIIGSIPGLKGLSGPFEEAAEAARKQGQFNLENFGQTKGLTKQQKIDNKLTNDKLKDYKKLRGEGKGISEALKTSGANAKQVKVGKLPVKSIGTFKAGFKALGPVITKALGPLALIKAAVDIAKFFIDAMFAASKATADFSRNMLLSRDSARDLYKIQSDITNQLNQQAREEGKKTILTESYRKALNSINGELGMQLNLSQDFGDATSKNVYEVARMQENFGLSAKASTQLFLEATKTGVPLEEMNKSIFGTLGLMSAQSGLQLDFNKVIEEAASVSGVLRSNFGGSTEAIAKAVYQSKLLGLSLDQMGGVSSNLLNFQSSIASELEAELLLGKDLNLEKAREYALLGKTELLMEEISKVAGSKADFDNADLITKQALAGALGMEADALSDMYEKKEKNDALVKKNLEVKNALMKDGQLILDDNFDLEKASLAEIRIASQAAGKSEEQLREILGDQIYLRKQEEDATQKFKKAIEQAKEAFANLVDGGALDKLADILTGLTESALFSGFAEEGKALNLAKVAEDEKNTYGLSDAEKKTLLSSQTQLNGVEKTATVAGSAAAGAAAGALIGSVVPGLGTAVGAIIGGLVGGLSAKVATDVVDNVQKGKLEESKEIARNKGIEGYLNESDNVEDFILRPGQRPIKFNKDDLLIGGTSLGGGGNDEVAMLLKELISEIRSGGDVYLDSTKVGTALTVGSYKMQ
jgi:hypothetical protein